MNDAKSGLAADLPDQPKRPAWQSSRTIGLAIIFLTYMLALLAGLIIYARLPFSLWLSVLLADIAATLVVWLSSLLFGNASVYDPYWSVQPVIILDLLLLQAGLADPAAVSICLVVNLWGVRLTANWITTFRSLEHQDWRYDLIKSESSRTAARHCLRTSAFFRPQSP